MATGQVLRKMRLFDMLTRAAERMQVQVLTCRGDVFSQLGGKRVQLTTA